MDNVKNNINFIGSIYEEHTHPDHKFPIIFHTDVYTSGMLFRVHWHENLEILYFVEGSATVTVAAKTFFIQAGEMAIIPSNTLHCVNSTTERIVFHCLIPNFDFCKKIGINLDNIFFDDKITDPFLAKKLDTIVSEFERGEDYFKPIILSEIISFLSHAARNYTSDADIPLDKTYAAQLKVIKTVFLYIEEHYSEHLSLDILAEQLGLTRYYFCHIFKKLTGTTPISYINYVRCKKATELLSNNSNMSVSTAAEQCGFSNLSYFTRTYKKHTGMLPSARLRSDD